MEPNALYRFATPPFEAHRRDVYTKYGEDGIIEEILGRLGGLRPNGLAVDCQAVSLQRSITRNLVENHAFRAWAVRCLDEFGEFEHPNLTVMEHLPPERPQDVALLCIDAPEVWDAFDPMVVIARIDPTVPPTLEGHGEPTFKTMVDLGARKGYAVVAHAGQSVVLVRSDLVPRLAVPGITLRDPARVFDWHAIPQRVFNDE